MTTNREMHLELALAFCFFLSFFFYKFIENIEHLIK